MPLGDALEVSNEQVVDMLMLCNAHAVGNELKEDGLLVGDDLTVKFGLLGEVLLE